MKNMRKLTALLLAVVMVLSLSIAAFARDGGTITNATINGETATISTTNYITATLNGTTAFSASEYSLRNATISLPRAQRPQRRALPLRRARTTRTRQLALICSTSAWT